MKKTTPTNRQNNDLSRQSPSVVSSTRTSRCGDVCSKFPSYEDDFTSQGKHRQSSPIHTVHQPCQWKILGQDEWWRKSTQEFPSNCVRLFTLTGFDCIFDSLRPVRLPNAHLKMETKKLLSFHSH